MKKWVKNFSIILILILMPIILCSSSEISIMKSANDQIYAYKGFYLSIVIGCVISLIILIVLIKRAIVTRVIEVKLKDEIKVINEVEPIFSSSFIQCWLAESWGQDRWIDELRMLQDIGINEIILQEVANTKSKRAVYPTKMKGYSYNDIDMIKTLLNAADSIGMKVRLGLGFNDNWWRMNAFSKYWLNSEAKINRIIVDELVENYESRPSFNGWYIPYEFYQLTAITKTQQLRLNNFLRDIASQIRKKSKKDIMIAPFYNGKFSLFGSLSAWSNMVINILKGTGIDIVALQDSIGAGFNSMEQLGSLYSYTKKATDTLGIRLYADTETFEIKSSKFISAKQDRISEQIFVERKYVQGFVAFSISHYQNKNIESQESSYNNYYQYYLNTKLSN